MVDSADKSQVARCHYRF